jgi:hypothetical protein
MVACQVTIDQTRQVTSECLLETTGPGHYGVWFVKHARQVVVSRVSAVRDLCVWSRLADASGHLVTIGIG